MRGRFVVLLVLGSALAGCAGGGSGQQDQTDQSSVDQSAPTVTIEVTGMT
jgi:hypothetical protein